jgi:hypothetical protein
MVLGADGQPLVLGVVGEALGHGPGAEDALHLQPQVVVEAGGIVPVDHVLEIVVRACPLCQRGRLRRLLEVAFRAVFVDRLA